MAKAEAINPEAEARQVSAHVAISDQLDPRMVVPPPAATYAPHLRARERVGGSPPASPSEKTLVGESFLMSPNGPRWSPLRGETGLLELLCERGRPRANRHRRLDLQGSLPGLQKTTEPASAPS